MALANFFSKDLLALTRIFNSQEADIFERILNSHIVCLAFDETAIISDEGKALLDLTIRLIARIYPNIQIQNLDTGNSRQSEKLKQLTKSINPDIDIVEDKDPTIVLVVGRTQYEIDGSPTFYLGSDGWISKFSDSSPVGNGETNNPIGAGGSACFGIANVFRYVFRDYLESPTFDQNFNFSFLSLQKIDEYSSQKSLPEIDLDVLHLVGIGAIGNGALWVLSRIPELKGELNLIDNEKVKLSNLQRYALCKQSDIDSKKVHVGANFFKQKNLNVFPEYNKWEEYLGQTKEWEFKQLAVCVDTAEDRIKIQGSLPKSIINAYTESNILGISRHLNFLDDACLACGYMPSERKKSYSVKVAESLSLEQHEKTIRKYLYDSKPVDKEMLKLISQANDVPLEKISQFAGKGLEEFYSEVVCGGILMKLAGSKESDGTIETPLAFQSALAGILLASEILVQNGEFSKKQLPTTSQINILTTLNRHQPNHFSLEKNEHGNCICGDEDFKKVYKEKWN